MKTLIRLLFIISFQISLSHAKIINIPADVDSIQGGIDMSVDGDTVLVQPSTYYENINFNGKNIVVGSLTLTTGDTSYISQTVIDGNSSGSVVIFENGEDSTAVLCGFTLKDGYSGSGGGIKITNSSPEIKKLIITSNRAITGAGIFLNLSNTKISQVTLTLNHNLPAIAGAAGLGAGIYCSSTNLRLSDLQIVKNEGGSGGGICCENSNLVLVNCIVSDNIVNNQNAAGGGVDLSNSNGKLSNVSVSCNSGVGISCSESQISLSKVTITRNTYGGMSFEGNSQAIFDSLNRCNIYFNGNYINNGNDLHFFDSLNNMAVVLDTFSVLNPTDFYASPIQTFTFDILNGKVEPVNSNLYVNPNGNNNNSGITPSEPLKTIDYAIRKILADSLNPHTLYLADGLYSSSTNGEIYPLNMRDYISLSGESKTGVILDGEGQCLVVDLFLDREIAIENLTITGGRGGYGGAIRCHASDAIILSDLIITGNTATVRAGGIYLGYSGADVTLKDVTIYGNSSGWGGGGVFVDHCNPEFFNVTFNDNIAYSKGGGVYVDGANPDFFNVTICGNTAIDQGGAIFCDSRAQLVNSIIWENAPENISGNEDIYAFYSDIQGGWSGIGNINTDPVFVDSANGDYRLQPESPCINKGIQDTIIVYNEGQDTLIIPAMDYIGSTPDMGAYESPYVVTKIGTISKTPVKFSLSQNYPNPFNPKTNIEYRLTNADIVNLSIYNLLGQKVATLVSEKQKAGTYEVQWDASGFASGIYIYTLKTSSGFKQSRKLAIIR